MQRFLQAILTQICLAVLLSGAGAAQTSERAAAKTPDTAAQQSDALQNGAEQGTVAVPADDEFKYPLALEGPDPAPITPPTRDEVLKSIVRGATFLVEHQNPDGSWGSARKTKALNIYAPVPGSHLAFRVGVTSLAVISLCETRGELPAELRTKADACLDRGEAWLLEHCEHLRRAETDALYNVWGHAYSIQAAHRLHQLRAGDAPRQAKLVELCRGQVDKLKRFEFINGGWSYYDFDGRTQQPSSSPMSFTTATALVALKDAEALGVEFPKTMVAKAVDSLMRQRYPDFSFAYGEYLRLTPRMEINRPAGSLGRSQACNLALRIWGDENESDAVLKNWLDRLFARNGWLSIGRKFPVPHESHFGVAGYFYYYGHFYAALCIDQLPAAERPHFQQHLAHILIPLQEKDGSWWDYPLYNYHQTWGTAMSISALVRCLPAGSDAAGG